MHEQTDKALSACKQRLLCGGVFILKRKKTLQDRAGQGKQNASGTNPGLYSGGPVLLFPGLKPAVIAAFGFNEFAGMRILIHLEHTRLPLFGG